MKKLPVILSSLLLVMLCLPAHSDDLPRRGWLGIQPAPVSAEAASAAGLKEPRGILVAGVVPGGTGEAIGLQSSDIILAINGTDITSGQVFGSALSDLYDGDAVSLSVARGAERLTLSGTIQGRPMEQGTDSVEVIYDTVDHAGGKLRAIITLPRERPETLPTVLFIPGYPCASYDPLNAPHPYYHLLYGLTEKGFAVVRVEKPMMGDSTGTRPCEGMDILEETAAFSSGLKKIRNYDFVDQDAVFIVGHSMGGISAPIVAAEAEKPVAGIIVYGTTTFTWFEYMLDLARFQNPRFGGDFVENDDRMRHIFKMFYEHYINGRSLKEVAAMNESYGTILSSDFNWDGNSSFLGRDELFWQSLQQLNMYRYWRDAATHVLSVYGEADIQALNELGHEDIADAVNHYHPGKGTFHLLEGTDHSFIEVGSMEESFAVRARGEYGQYVRTRFNHRVVDLFSEWMHGIVSTTAGSE